MNKIKVFEAFAGYGSQSMALKRLGIDFEVVGISEIDKYAIQAYNAVHGETKNYGDICKINWDEVPDFDFFTYSFPCTDISTAGQQKGLAEGSGTRSSLLWECKKAIDAKNPKYLMMENVKALTYKKFIPYLHKWLAYLDGIGYKNYSKVLNAKDYGIPQNRERLFVISVLCDEKFEFPKPFDLKVHLSEILENKIDDYYYCHPANKWITSERASKTIDMKKAAIDPEFSICITARGFISWKCTYVTRRNNKVTILTNREVFRLMGVNDEDIDKIQKSGISRTQQYKMAGNSIVVDVLYHIFRKLFLDKQPEERQLSLF